MKIKIRQISLSEIPQLKDFAPPDWNSDLVQFFSFHFKYDYFYPIVGEVDKKIIGCGCIIRNRTAGWLGNIIVIPEYRRQGIGEQLTKHLMDYLDKFDYTIQLLIATKMGEPLYSKLGFMTSSKYLFYKTDSVNQFEVRESIRMMTVKDYNSVKELDRNVTGEERSNFIERFLLTGYVYTSGSSSEIKGFYLPDFGNGLIIANNNQAGLDLLRFKLSQGHTKVVIPEANITAKNFLTENGFQEYSVCPRMVLGRDVEWKPEFVFSRASGYCG
jgi:GNAT superfamily N-acetyltransferase